MKVLMIFSKRFKYKTAQKNLENHPDIDEEHEFRDALVAFIQAEEKDEEADFKSTEKKLVNLIKWGARKNEIKNVVLHSFAHLSESKASPEFTRELFDKAELRLQNADYSTGQTPFGYFLDLSIEAPGYSLARIFKSF